MKKNLILSFLILISLNSFSQVILPSNIGDSVILLLDRRDYLESLVIQQEDKINILLNITNNNDSIIGNLKNNILDFEKIVYADKEIISNLETIESTQNKTIKKLKFKNSVFKLVIPTVGILGYLLGKQ